MKRLIVIVALLSAGCSAAAPVQGPVESPNTPLVVLENSGQSVGQVNEHYDDVNEMTEDMFRDR